MLVNLAFVMQTLKKYLKKFLSWSAKMEGTHSCYEGDIELMGVPPVSPTRENPEIYGQF